MLFKLLLTIAIVYVVLFFFKHRARIAAAHRTVMDDKARERAQARTSAGEAAARRPGTPIAQDLVACPKCGAYSPAGTPCACEKA